MNEKPILFSAPMVRAILAGKKTQTRRLMKPQPDGVLGKTWPDEDRWQWASDKARSMVDAREASACSPFGVRGDRLWVRETWSKDCLSVYPCPPIWYRADFYAADDPTSGEHARHCKAEKTGRPEGECFACAGRFRWKPSIFMRRRDSRLTLRVASIRVERLQDISEADAAAEGVAPLQMDNGSCLPRFEGLWDSINGDRCPWASNPWVWVVGFEVAR